MLSSDIEAIDALRLLSRHDASPLAISRRRFLQAIAAGVGGTMAASLLPAGVASALTTIGAHDGVLLLINLSGGLDGLNTVVPFGQGAYYDLRPDIAVPEAATLPIGPGVGLHPRLTFVKERFDVGQVAIVQGVGVPDPDFSHFTMQARWMDGSARMAPNPATGWIGRWLDGLATTDLLQAVHLGWGGTPLHLIGGNRSAVALDPSNGGYGAIADPWIQDSYRAIREMAANSAAPGTWANTVATTMKDQLTVASLVAPAYIGAPSGAMREFAVAAGLLNANVGIRVVSISLGTFDTHSGQPTSLDKLLGELNDGLQLFWSILSPSLQTRATAMTFSEFGRRALGNKSTGSDHGAASHLFVMGPRVRGGLHGSYPSLTNLLSSSQLRATVDFREVYQQVLDRWLGGDARQLLGAPYQALDLFAAAPGDLPVVPSRPPTPEPVIVPGPIGTSYRPLVPERLLDTRSGLGAPVGPVGPQGVIDLTVAGMGHVPPTGAVAVLMNVTATAPTEAGYLTTWPSGSPRPEASNLNFGPGQTVANLVLAKVGVDGKVSLCNAAGKTHVLADVCGYFVEGTTGSRLVPLSPERVMDTRSLASGALSSGGVADVVVTALGGVPAAGVDAVVLNVTAVAPTSAGFLTVWPSGEAMPSTSNLNFVAGKTVPNLVVAKVGAGGAVRVFNASGTTHLVVDIVGYFALTAGSGTMAVTPTRLLDSRTTAPVGPDATLDLLVVGVGPIPATGVQSVTINVTAVAPTEAGYLTVFPSGTSTPTASNLNFVAGQTVANLVVAKVGNNGKIGFYNRSGKTNIIVDIVGYSVM